MKAKSEAVFSGYGYVSFSRMLGGDCLKSYDELHAGRAGRQLLAPRGTSEGIPPEAGLHQSLYDVGACQTFRERIKIHVATGSE